MGLSLFGNKSKSKGQYDPWDEYFLNVTGGDENTPGVRSEAVDFYKESGWTPQMEEAANTYRDLLSSRLGDNYFKGVTDTGINVLEGNYDPNINRVNNIEGVSPITTRDVRTSPVKFTGVKPGNASYQEVAPNNVDFNQQVQNINTNLPNARAAQGVLDPTISLSKLLSGRPDNPYLDSQANAIVNILTRNMNENVMPGIRGDAILSGQYGGSRQGIAEGLATSRLNQDLAPALTQLYGGAYENAQNRMDTAANNLNNQAFSSELGNVERATENQKFNIAKDYQVAFDNANREFARQQFNSRLGYQANSDNVNRDLTGQQFNSNLGYQAGVDNANRDLIGQQFNSSLGYQAASDTADRNLNTQQYNAGLGLNNNAQELQRASQVVSNKGTGLDYLQGGMGMQDDLYSQYLDTYLTPQNVDMQNLNNYSNTMFAGAGLGNQTKGKTTTTPGLVPAIVGTVSSLAGMGRGLSSLGKSVGGINFQQQGNPGTIPEWMMPRRM